MNYQKTNQTIEVLFGLSASGKSTYAKDKVEKDATWKRVNKDEIREQFPNGIKEKKVIEIETESIQKYLEKGYNIIIDSTNLNPVHLGRFKSLWGLKYNIIENRSFLDVPIEVCIERGKQRKDGKNWESIIRKQADDWLDTPEMIQNRNLPWIVLSDCDGCINHVSPNRSPYDGSLCYLDEPNEIVVDYLTIMHERGIKIVLMSGLEDCYRTNRESWLKANNVPYDELYMRKAGDSRKDAVIKGELFDAHIKDKYYIYSLIEDRMSMRRHYTGMGLSSRMFSIGNCFKEF